MRVVSGSRKGLYLKAVPGKGTRPTTDKVKESIFNIIGPYFEGGQVLDLFGGSGGLGIEALSRGMEHAIFVDADAKALQTIKENLQSTDFVNHAEVYRNDARRALKAIIKRDIKFDLIILDPPYKDEMISSIISIISDHNLMNSGGLIVAEHHKDIRLQPVIQDYEEIKYENYGICSIQVYRKIDK